MSSVSALSSPLFGNELYLNYLQCVQRHAESTLQYSYRYQVLVSQLGYLDDDPVIIQRYIDGLSTPTQLQLILYKRSMRTMGVTCIPTWEFSSLTATANLAVTMSSEPNYSPQPSTITTASLSHSRISSPDIISTHCVHRTQTSSAITSVAITTSSSHTPSRKRKISSISNQVNEKCHYHPKSTTHTTDECRAKSCSESRQHSSSNVCTNTELCPIKCFRCQGYGHYAYQCPQRFNSGNQRNKVKETKAHQDKVKLNKNDDIKEYDDGDAIAVPSTTQPTKTN